MRILILLLLTLWVGVAASAENKEAKKLTRPIQRSKKQRTVSELKKSLRTVKDETMRFYLLGKIVARYAREKITSENSSDAESSASSLLKAAENYKTDWDFGNAVHHAHVVLGRVNLLRNELDHAKAELLLAADIPGSPQLNSFGPNMVLAKELLEKSERKTVLKYFDDCLKFWKAPHASHQIDEWKKAIDDGKTPEFGANLTY